MTCPLTITPDTNNLISFEARYILNGSFAASVSLTNQERQYEITCDSSCAPISVSLDLSTDLGCCEGNSGLFGDLNDCLIPEGSNTEVEWVAGLYNSLGENFEEVETVDLTVVSYFNYLNEKPVSTQQFPYELLSTVILTVSNFYAGIPTLLRDYNVNDCYIRGPVNGGSLLEELRLLAQAGKSHLFVQVGGILTMESWKDNNSTVDYVFPQELVYSAARAPYSAPNVNLVRARGAEIATVDCGEQPFTDARVTDDSGGVNGIPGYFSKTTISGLETPKVKVSFENLSAATADLKNAKYLSDSVQISGIEEIGDGNVTVTMEKTDGSFFGPSPSTQKTVIYGTRKDRAEYTAGNQAIPELAARQQRNTVQGSVVNNYGYSPFPIPWGSFGNAFGIPYSGNVNTTFAADQPSYSSVETHALIDAVSVCGNKLEEIENKYVLTKERLFLLAVRRHQEILMESNTWNFEIPYIPCLRLNQVITLPIPDRLGLPEREVTGVIAGLDVSYNAEDAETTMRLTVWDFSCIGNTTYRSGNLLMSGCGGADSSISNPYVTSSLSIDSNAGVDGGNGWLFAVGAGTGFFNLTQEDMTVGGDYTISFTYEMFGANSFGFSGAGLAAILSGSGIYSATFNPTLTSHVFVWTMAGNAFPTYFKITNISITRELVA